MLSSLLSPDLLKAKIILKICALPLLPQVVSRITPKNQFMIEFTLRNGDPSGSLRRVARPYGLGETRTREHAYHPADTATNEKYTKYHKKDSQNSNFFPFGYVILFLKDEQCHFQGVRKTQMIRV